MIGKKTKTIPINLFNTLDHKTELFRPIDDGKVTIYACGPTVYDYQHIGNYRTFIMVDIFHRLFLMLDYNVELAVNITDVGHLTSDADEGEDKIAHKAIKEGKTAWDVAKFYEKAFFDDLEWLHIKKPTFTPRATEHIQEMISLIEEIEKNGYTYQTKDGIYFDTSKDSYYADLARLSLSGQQTSNREIVQTDKRHPADFSLWKFSTKPGRNMVWDSPWGKGFPGWHIECSAMSVKYLGQPFDIHMGGVDHIPVHNTNEIAQTKAATGKELAHYFVHFEHLLLNGKKMSKSDGTFIRPLDLDQKGYSADAFRYLCLSAHYQEKLNFTWQSIEGAQNAIDRIKRVAQQEGPSDEAALEEGLGLVADNLATPTLLAFLESKNNPWLWREFNAIFGFNFEKEEIVLTQEQKNLLEKRQTLRLDKKFDEADNIRQELLKEGIAIKDTPGGIEITRAKPGL